MRKWIIRVVLIGIIGLAGLFSYEFYRGGYFDLPEIPKGACIASFKSGLRAIVLDPDVSQPRYCSGDSKFFRRLQNAGPDRRYISVPFDVPYWAEEAWSMCSAPTDEEQSDYQAMMPGEWADVLEGARLDAVCRLDVDGKELIRGLIYSVPRL